METALAANKDVIGKLAEIIKNFDSSKDIDINIYDGETTNNKPGQMSNSILTGINFSADITLQTSFFNQNDRPSKEFLIGILIHEFVHAYIKKADSALLNTAHHNEISTKYIEPMTEYLKQSFGISDKDAFSLAWSGVPDSEVFQNATSAALFTYGSGSSAISISKGEIQSRSAAYAGNTGYLEEGVKGTQLCN